MKKIAFYTLGCKVNQSDTASMEKLFRDAGFQIVDFEEPADICLINTCVVTNMGQSKSRKIIHRAARRDPKPLIVVTGCYPQTSPDEVVHIDGVDLIIGNQDRSKVVELVRERMGESPDEAPINAVHDLPVGREFEELDAAVDASRNRAFLKIQEGCDQYCAYCIIPMIRGRHRSRSQQDVVREAETLIRSGVKEICLIAQDITYYGMDKWTDARPNRRSAVDSSRGESLASLLRALNAIEGEFWIRLLYTHPAHWSDELTAAIAECPKVARYVDIPLQHISDNMLDAMQRVTDGDYIRTLLRNIRKAVPGIAIRTTFITGFPGETEDDHQELMEFIEEFRFERAGIFTFSREEGTKAYKMPNQVHHRTKARRYNEATLLLARLASETGQEQIGRQIRVLVDAPGVARTEWDAPDIDGTVSVPLTLPVGQFATVTVTDAVAYELTAE